MSKRLVIICGEEIMAHFPDGQVKFITFVGFLRLAWWAIRNKVEVVIEDGNAPRSDKEGR